ncbi:MAG: transporter [Pyrinomonadaceae bacterium]
MTSIISFLFLLPLFSVEAFGQQRPLITEDVDIIPPGSIRLETGIDFLQRAKFPVSRLNGDLTNLGVIGLSVGLSPNVEFQIEGTIRQVLSINSISGPSAVPLNFNPLTTNSTNDIGDFTLAAKIKLRAESEHAPSLGFRFGVQLPNSNQERGLGLNQTNAFGTVLMGKKFGEDGRFNTFGNLGLAILTAPTAGFTQNDVLLYGAAGIFRLTNRFNIAGEVNGRANLRSGGAPLGTESQSQARLGFQFKTSGLRFDLAGIAGLNQFSPRSGVTFGVTYDSPSIFTPAK